MPLLSRLLLLSVCFFPALNGFAQFNDSVHHQVNFTSSGSINQTTDRSAYLLNNALRYSLRRDDARLNFSNTWIYGQQDKRLTNNDYVSTLDFNLYKTFKHFYYWGLGNYQTNYSLKILNQVQGGLGAAYNVFDKEEFRVNISNGILFEQSSVLVDDSVRNNYQTFRNSFRLQVRWRYKKIISVDGIGFIQNSLNYGDDYILKANLNASLRLMKWVSFTTALTYNKITKTNRENLLFTYGLTFERFF